jgi:hypothetical protein
MAHTHNQDLDNYNIALEKVNDQTRKDIFDLTSNISNINSWLTPLEALLAIVNHLTIMCQQSQEEVNNLTGLFNKARDTFSYAPPYNLEGTKSSHSTSFHSNHF